MIFRIFFEDRVSGNEPPGLVILGFGRHRTNGPRCELQIFTTEPGYIKVRPFPYPSSRSLLSTSVLVAMQISIAVKLIVFSLPFRHDSRSWQQTLRGSGKVCFRSTAFCRSDAERFRRREVS